MFSETPNRVAPQKAVISHPLEWPEGWPTTTDTDRHQGRIQEDFVVAMEKLEKELGLFGAKDVRISTNVRVDKDGRNLPGTEGVRVANPGVGVIFTKEGEEYTIGYDGWSAVGNNLAHLAQHLLALRRIMDTGGKNLVEHLLKSSALTAHPSAAEPATESPPATEEATPQHDTEEDIEEVPVEVITLDPTEPWWEVLQLTAKTTMEEVLEAHTRMRNAAQKAGDAQRLYSVDEAFAKAKAALNTSGLDESF